MSAPAVPVPVSDEVTVHRLLHVLDELADLLGAVATERQQVIVSVLGEVEDSLSALGYAFRPARTGIGAGSDTT